MQRKLILASKSPRRKQILESVGLKFIIDVGRVDEENKKGLSPLVFVRKLSEAKIRAVENKYKDAVILGADTIVVLGDEIIGKPKSLKDAEKILGKLSGRMHLVITSFTVFDSKSKKQVTKTVKTKVWFKELDEDKIKSYVKTKEPMDKAGGYGIQDKGGVFIEKIDGDFFNVVGLPIQSLIEVLKEFGIEIANN